MWKIIIFLLVLVFIGINESGAEVVGFLLFLLIGWVLWRCENEFDDWE